MARETLIDSRQEILRTAGRLFQQRGYDATSMNDVAAALKLSKGGHIQQFPKHRFVEKTIHQGSNMSLVLR